MPKSGIAPSDQRSAGGETRNWIKSVAEELYVLHGYEGFSFGDIAEKTGTTRANIHHHFRNKKRLMGELIDQFTRDAESRIESLWGAHNVPFFLRLELQVEDFRRFYSRFNTR